MATCFRLALWLLLPTRARPAAGRLLFLLVSGFIFVAVASHGPQSVDPGG